MSVRCPDCGRDFDRGCICTPEESRQHHQDWLEERARDLALWEQEKHKKPRPSLSDELYSPTTSATRRHLMEEAERVNLGIES